MKLHLSEDFEISDQDQQVSVLINQLIKHEWETIDLYNGIIMQFNSMNSDSSGLSELIKDKYITIGQLEKMLQNSNPDAALIDQAKSDVQVEVIVPGVGGTF